MMDDGFSTEFLGNSQSISFSDKFCLVDTALSSEFKARNPTARVFCRSKVLADLSSEAYIRGRKSDTFVRLDIGETIVGKVMLF